MLYQTLLIEPTVNENDTYLHLTQKVFSPFAFVKNAFTSCAAVVRRPCCLTHAEGSGTSARVIDAIEVSVGAGEAREFSGELAIRVLLVGSVAAGGDGDLGNDGKAAFLFLLARRGPGGGDSERARTFSDGIGARPERRGAAVSTSKSESELESSL